jgi:hypothetical protein
MRLTPTLYLLIFKVVLERLLLAKVKC